MISRITSLNRSQSDVAHWNERWFTLICGSCILKQWKNQGCNPPVIWTLYKILSGPSHSHTCTEPAVSHLLPHIVQEHISYSWWFICLYTSTCSLFDQISSVLLSARGNAALSHCQMFCSLSSPLSYTSRHYTLKANLATTQTHFSSLITPINELLHQSLSSWLSDRYKTAASLLCLIKPKCKSVAGLNDPWCCVSA